MGEADEADDANPCGTDDKADATRLQVGGTSSQQQQQQQQQQRVPEEEEEGGGNTMATEDLKTVLEHQEAVLKSKYGNLKPMQKLMEQRGGNTKRFDSADWALAKERGKFAKPPEKPVKK